MATQQETTIKVYGIFGIITIPLDSNLSANYICVPNIKPKPESNG